MTHLSGAIWMTAAMGLYAVIDTLIKIASDTVPRVHIIVAFGLFGLIMFSLGAMRKGLKPLPIEVFQGAALLRSIFEATASTIIVYALGMVDLSLFSSILQMNPLLVVMGAAIFFGHPVGWRRWMAILVGLIGVLVVLRPGGSAFNPATLLVILAVFFQSARDLVTSRVSPKLDSMQLSASAFLSLAIVGLGLGIVQDTEPFRPDARSLALISAICLISLPAVYATITAMRSDDISFVAPFRYTRIIFGLALGVAVFGEVLDGYTILGSAVIVASGLYTLWRETRLRRSSPSNPPALYNSEVNANISDKD